MHKLYDKIENRINELKKVVQQKQKQLENVHPGILNVHSSGNKACFYYKESSDTRTRKYLKNSEQDLIRELCQKDYDQKVLAAAQKELNQLEKLKKVYEQPTYEEIIGTINIHRQPYIIPDKMSDEEFIKKWETVTYTGKEFANDIPEYYTDKGERVRSKSEILIANILERKRIPYRYEAPLFLEGYGIVYPDFTILDVKARKEWYLEHLGMMDDPVYAEKAVKKIETYEKNGIYTGKNLILTYETRKSPLNPKLVKDLLKIYLE